MYQSTEKAAPGAGNTESGKTEDQINPVSDSISKEVENFKKIDEKEIIRVLMVLGYEYAARDRNGDLYAFKGEPEYSDISESWANDYYIQLPAYLLLRLPSGVTGCISLLDYIRRDWVV